MKIASLEEPEPEVNKASLQEAITAAETLDPARFSGTTWTALEQALANAKAVNDDPDATQAEVDAALEALNTKLSALAPRANETTLLNDFSGTQRKNGWCYGACDYDGANFTELPYEADNERYYNNGAKPELKKDFVEPGSGRNAGYKWIAAEDGTVSVTGEYVKFANSEGTGTAFRIRLNGNQELFEGFTGTSASERSKSFDLTLEVKAGDELLFQVDPEGDDAWDGGRLTVVISPAESGEPETKYSVSYKYDGEYPEAVMSTLPKDDGQYANGETVTAKEPLQTAVDMEEDGKVVGTWTFDGWDKDSETVNGADIVFTGTWTYAAAEPETKYSVSYKYDGEYPEAVMSTLPKDDGQYANGETVTAKEPLQTAVDMEEDGKVVGTWTFDGWDKDSETVNGADIVFTGTWTYAAAEPETKYSVSYKYDGEYPEAVMNTLPKDEEKYANGEVATAKMPSPSSVEATKDGDRGAWEFKGWDKESVKVNNADVVFTGTWTFRRTNNAVLKDDFSAVQGTNGWYYGAADYNGANFGELPYDAAGTRYMLYDENAGNYIKPELKADYAEPGSGRNAAYKWVAAENGQIRVVGEYVKFANSNDPAANGTCFRITLMHDGTISEKKFVNMKGNFEAERSESFDLTFDVQAGDAVFFLVDPELGDGGNDFYDGGRITAAITPAD